ncbi:MFS transporter [Mycolicibacterium sp. OfavD-34-C]|nr:MFS transporter [Mycolicibacterium sp. OfavD-34-C]MCG7580968.1 MFS transporter [Mycolicibacterium sp. OfavD-34-C]
MPRVSAMPPEAGAVRLSSARGRWILAVTVLGSGVAFLEATVVNIALPHIADELETSTAGLQWTVNGYLLTLASLILLGGALGDRHGHRRVFMTGIVWFTLASVLCAAAPTIEFLVAARILQGVGGALLTPGSLAIINSTFHPDDRARAIGAWSGLSGVAAAIGPLVGGYLISSLSWRAIFLINVPLGLFVVAMAWRKVPETQRRAAASRLDFPGAALVALGLAGTTYALIQSPEGVTSVALAAGVVGAASLAGFVVVERRSAHPMVPPAVFGSKQFTAANIVTFVVYTALGGVFFMLVAFLQVSLGYSPTSAGLASLPITGLMLLLSARAGMLARRIGPRTPLTIGPLLIAAGVLLMAAIDPGDRYISAVLPAVVVFGLGLSLVVAPVTATALAAVDSGHAGVASGINNAVSRVANLIAVAVLPLVAGLSAGGFTDPDAMAAGFRTAMLATAVVAAAGGAIAWLMIDPMVLATAPAGTEGDADTARDTRRHCGVAGTPLQPAPATPCRPDNPRRA